MAKRATEHVFTGTTTPVTSYDSTKTNLGKHIVQVTGSTNEEKWAGPKPMLIGRPTEASTNIPLFFPHALIISPTKNWIFFADGAAAAITRRIVVYEHDHGTAQSLTWKGFVTLTYPTATNHTIRGLRVVRYLHSTGTASCSAGTAVTGSSSDWVTERIAAGGRIGFGTTDPTQVTTWYYVSSIGGETSITLTGNGPSTGGQVAYVIEEIRIYTSNTNATATNGGLYVAKGVNYDDFAPAGVTIAAATTTDNLKAVYWLKDASTETNTAATGIAIVDPPESNTTHTMYVPDTTGGIKIYKYNARVSLASLSSGASTSAFVHATGSQSITGTVSQTNNGRIATASHGPGSGVSSLYFLTTTRIYRIPETAITASSTTFIADAMMEIPTGSASTFTAGAALTSLEYAGVIDRFMIMGSAATKSYVTKYRTDASMCDRIWGMQTLQLDQSLTDPGTAPFPSMQTGAFSVWVEDGMCYLARASTSTAANQIYAFPVAMDWDFAASVSGTGRLITPSLSTTGAVKFYRVYVNEDLLLGSSILGMPTEPYRVYFRTNGIADNTGSWNLVDSGDLTGISGADAIQFMFEFRVIGSSLLTSRLHGVCVTYEDSSTDSHYQPSVAHTDRANKRFAWRFSTAFGGTVPTLTVKLYDAVAGTLLLSDTTVAQTSGTFEKSTNDGSAWGSYNTTDKGNETTYIRYTANSLGDNMKIRAIITQ